MENPLATAAGALSNPRVKEMLDRFRAEGPGVLAEYKDDPEVSGVMAMLSQAKASAGIDPSALAPRGPSPHGLGPGMEPLQSPSSLRRRLPNSFEHAEDVSGTSPFDHLASRNGEDSSEAGRARGLQRSGSVGGGGGGGLDLLGRQGQAEPSSGEPGADTSWPAPVRALLDRFGFGAAAASGDGEGTASGGVGDGPETACLGMSTVVIWLGSS